MACRTASVLLVVAALAGCGPRRVPETAAEGTAVLTVMTYNVNFGLAGDPETLAAVAGAGADVVLLQETNEEWEKALRDELGDEYPFMAFHHCCGAGGLAVLARHAFVEKAYVDSPSGWFPALLVEVDSPLGPLQLLNVHLHPPVSESGSVVSGYFSTPDVRLEEIAVFHEHLAPGLPTLVAGDFNEKEGGKAASYLAERGFTSVLPEFSPGEKTWRWETSVGEISSRFDHIMYSGGLYPLSAKVLDEGRSDHLPVMAVFRVLVPGEIPSPTWTSL